MMNKRWIIGALAMCMATTAVLGEAPAIELSSRNVRFKYTVDHKQALHLESVGSVDG
jgi:alanine-alpha-ketoisovalerate/valine-pyruvate aminotransferase